MQRLIEVDGQKNESDEKVKLDGQEILREDLDKKRENQGVRIIETNPGDYKTLTKLRG